MDNQSQEIAQWRKQFDTLFRPEGILRVLKTLISFQMGALVLGFAFSFMAMGISIGILSFFMYWQPAYDVFVALAKLDSAPAKLARPWLPWWQIPLLVIKAAMSIGLIAAGLRVLFQAGFCGQNLICLLLRH